MQHRLAEYLCLCSVVVALVTEGAANVKRISAKIVSRDLDGTFDSGAHVLDKHAACNPIALSNRMRKDKFRVRVDTSPKPIIAALSLIVLRKSASVCADILPLL